MLGEDLAGKQFGIVGAGTNRSEATAKLAEAHGAKPLLAGRNDDLGLLLETADVVSLHCPSTPETHHLIDAAALARMKPTAVLVNTARGPIVDERALVAALRDGSIAGAALDVYEHEPAVADELLTMENVVLTPHLGSATSATRDAMGLLAVQALRSVLLDGARRRTRSRLDSMRERLLAWYREHGRDLPWRETRDPYAILVSEVMLQQTQVERVIPRWLAWLERWPTAEALAAASPADVIVAWQGLGYNRRAVSLHRAARLVAAHGWPDDLTELPGVGPYTAAAVGNFAFGRDVLPVDTNVAPDPGAHGRAFDGSCTQALFDLGATICLARIPRCGVCPLAAACPSRGSRYEPLRKQSKFEGSFRAAPRARAARGRSAASSRATARRSSRSSATGSSCCATASRRCPCLSATRGELRLRRLRAPAPARR